VTARFVVVALVAASDGIVAEAAYRLVVVALVVEATSAVRLETYSLVEVAFVVEALIATRLVAVRSSMVASAASIALLIVPIMDVPRIDPPVMVGLEIEVLES